MVFSETVENDYCGGKMGFVVGRLGLVRSLGLGLDPQAVA